LTQKADTLGVDGILLVAPYYNRPSDEGVYRHFASIAQSTSLPVMIYNIPGRTGINVPVQVTLRLAEIANIVATKEAHSDLDHVTKLVANAPKGFYVYSGDDSLTLPFLSVGAHGIVSVASHVIGQQMKEMIHLFLNGETQLATAIHLKLHPIFKGLFECPHRVPNPAPVKHALNIHGFSVGGVRLPLLEVTESEGEYIKSLFS
jgi:4-hydroxy-tetrahydrodipicolinate synthase